MSKEEFDDSCTGCRPTIIDPSTLKLLPDDHPHMKILHTLWDDLSIDSKTAWHRVTCQNSREAVDLKRVKEFTDQFVQLTQAN